MNFKLKDIIIIAAVMLTSFPVLYAVLLFATGTARIVFETENKQENEVQKSAAVMKQSAKRDSLVMTSSRAFQALQKERLEIAKQRQRLKEQQERLDMLQQELETQRKEMLGEREKLELLVSKSDSLDMKKMRDLAKVYGAMKPAEAAQILETMSEETTAKILQMINDDRQKAKILALLPTGKAAGISKVLANLNKK